jgi:hypothetical protein
MKIKKQDAPVERFHPRYINLSAITDRSSTISSQCWVNSWEDIEDAERILRKWATPAEEKWHNGRVIFGAMFDTHTHVLRTFERENDGLVEVSAEEIK